MMNEQGTGHANLYWIYIVIGVLYVAVKVGFVSAGYLHTGAIAHGAVPTVLTVAAGVMAIRRIRDSSGTVLKQLMTVLPILIFVITPVFMYLKMGDQWLANGRLSILVVYECLVVIQFVTAVRISNSLSAGSGP
jgi:hypothetical protein